MENRLNISVNKIKDIPNVDFTNKEYVDENLGEYLNAISAIIRL
jgi:type IV pilus assembly protein PilM